MESESVAKTNVQYKAQIAILEAEQNHLRNILAEHQTTCKIQRGDHRDPNCWQFDPSETFRIPAFSDNIIHNHINIQDSHQREAKTLHLLDAQDNLHIRSESMFRCPSPVKSSLGQYERQKYYEYMI